MVNIVKTGNSFTFYEGGHNTIMDNAETIAAIIRAFDNAGIDYYIIEDTDSKMTEYGTIKKLFR